jgi:hypothetical protein
MSFSRKSIFLALLSVLMIAVTTTAMASIAQLINPFGGYVKLIRLVIGLIAIILICSKIITTWQAFICNFSFNWHCFSNYFHWTFTRCRIWN